MGKVGSTKHTTHAQDRTPGVPWDSGQSFMEEEAAETAYSKWRNRQALSMTWWRVVCCSVKGLRLTLLGAKTRPFMARDEHRQESKICMTKGPWVPGVGLNFIQ